MPPDRHSNDPAAWLRHAEGDLDVARMPKGVLPKYRCGHAHQAAEKALKAVCLARGIKLKYTHSLRVLLADLKASGVNIPAKVVKVQDLDVFGAAARYPMRGRLPEFRPDDAVEKARIALEWAQREISLASPQRLG